MRQTDDDLANGTRVGRASIRGFSPAALRRRRSQKTFSLAELATLSGVSAATINAWETERSAPTPRTLGSVADALGIRVADLVTIKEDDLHMADLRFQAGLTQGGLAAAAGITMGILTAIESGHREPDGAQLQALAAALNVESEWLAAVWARTRAARIARLKSL
jgi:transcriptional regulator with XRE-family HTH domain